jgi:farnesyl diphosphate synthase
MKSATQTIHSTSKRASARASIRKAAKTMFIQRLEANARRVEERLEALLSARTDGAYPPADRLAEAMRYGALGGGKRLRPHLLIDTAGLFGIAPEAALDAAVALECVHCYSLIHDDLPAMDDDDLRRGRPTVHRQYDDATAILAGDALLTLAFEIMAGEAAHPDADVRIRLVSGLAQASGWAGMAGGQMLDLQAAHQTLSHEDIARLQAMKTGALLKFACEAGGLIAGAGEAEMQSISRFGALIGQAFQLADDLLDAEGDPKQMGKAAAKDEAAGKATLVALLGIDQARGRLYELEREALAALAPLGERARPLAETANFVIRRSH